ncbi:unnamed protein product [Linum trigynum]|uniref:Uncharacterized protein n=1 Tax=Linum trigynum TaxID=586398 RepID=A0AAV2G9L5_9ROSI
MPHQQILDHRSGKELKRKRHAEQSRTRLFRLQETTLGPNRNMSGCNISGSHEDIVRNKDVGWMNGKMKNN